MKKIAVIRLRGLMGVKKDIKDTMKMLRLHNKNHCVVINNSPNYIGMLRKVKDYVTWGEINEKTFKELLLNRGRIVGKKNVDEEYIKEKKVFAVDDTFLNRPGPRIWKGARLIQDIIRKA